MRNTNPSLTFKVKEIITRDIGHNWSLESVANILCMSTSSLKKNLKTEGSTYRDIITQCRMQYAAKLLQTHNHLVTYQLASQCGYSHLSYFIHVFRKYYGVTPYQYSKKEIAA
ncbi:helix-turn-helix domain-containing protein [Hafnia paralvei]|nr:helix-turn-helix domain-containing protein [Hafnia paralvei]